MTRTQSLIRSDADTGFDSSATLNHRDHVVITALSVPVSHRIPQPVLRASAFSPSLALSSLSGFHSLFMTFVPLTNIKVIFVLNWLEYLPNIHKALHSTVPHKMGLVVQGDNSSTWEVEDSRIRSLRLTSAAQNV